MRKAALLLLLSGIVATAAEAQRAHEWQVHSMATLADEEFLAGGVGFALRSDGRTRAGIALSMGVLEGEAAFRPELLFSFHLNPFRRHGVAPYAGGGIAAVFTGERREEYLVGTLGIEAKPGSKSGWFLEAGVGGGFRIVAGLQLRVRAAR